MGKRILPYGAIIGGTDVNEQFAAITSAMGVVSEDLVTNGQNKVVDSFTVDSDGTAEWVYVAEGNNNVRGGVVTAFWDYSAGTISYNDTHPVDIGTAQVQFVAEISGSTISLRMYNTAGSGDYCSECLYK